MNIKITAIKSKDVSTLSFVSVINKKPKDSAER